MVWTRRKLFRVEANPATQIGGRYLSTWQGTSLQGHRAAGGLRLSGSGLRPLQQCLFHQVNGLRPERLRTRSGTGPGRTSPSANASACRCCRRQPGHFPDANWDSRQPRRLGIAGRHRQHLSIGQGEMDVTPLQMAVMTSAVANGGKVLWPRLVDRRESADRPGPASSPQPDI